MMMMMKEAAEGTAEKKKKISQKNVYGKGAATFVYFFPFWSKTVKNKD